MKTPCSISEVSRVLQEGDSFVIVSHYNPDADAYGSSLGLYNALKAMGKNVTVCNETGIIQRYISLPSIQGIKNTPQEGEILLICDCGSYSRVGDSFKDKFKNFKKSVNIDHHVSNEFFSPLNYVDITASSTSEMIFDILTDAQIPITKEAAICMLAGIIGDTGSFQYTCATQKTFQVAEKLMSYGASPSEISRALFGSTPLSVVKLHAEALLSANFLFEDQFAEIIVTADMLSKHKASMDDTEGLAEKGRDIQNVKVSACYRQDGPIWRISMRSTSDKYNVSDVAGAFGGGGHKVAAAFRSTKSLESIQESLRTKIKEILR